MTRTLLVCALLLTAGCHHEHAEDRIVEARGFVVTNEEGRPRGLWEYRPDRQATTFSLLDEQERLRANVMVFGDEPTVNLLDRNGTIRANLALQGDTPSLTLAGPDGAHRVVVGMSADADAAPRVSLKTASGTWLSLATLADSDGLVVIDAEGRVVGRIQPSE